MEDSELFKVRREKVEALAASGVETYPNDAKVTHVSRQILDAYGQMDNEALEKVTERFTLAGRIMADPGFRQGGLHQHPGPQRADPGLPPQEPGG